MKKLIMNNYTKFNIAGFLLILLSVGCQKSDIQELETRSWNLVWSDEFEGDSLSRPDSTKWTFDLGNGDGGWGNQELQSYTNSPQNVSLDGAGNLIIRAISVGNSFTSARLKTQGLYSQKYGRFEARLKTPYGPGLWPAFWMLGDNITEVPWPKCGEIDIMELRGQSPHMIAGTIHGPGYSGGNPITKSYALPNDRFDTKFHVFAIEWDEDKIDFFVDDFLYQRIEKESVPGTWVYDQSFFMILNIAVGGNYVGFPTSETPFPQTMTVDYVRAYQNAD
jgi:beta-glucanase (GH16 family)